MQKLLSYLVRTRFSFPLKSRKASPASNSASARKAPPPFRESISCRKGAYTAILSFTQVFFFLEAPSFSFTEAADASARSFFSCSPLQCSGVHLPYASPGLSGDMTCSSLRTPLLPFRRSVFRGLPCAHPPRYVSGLRLFKPRLLSGDLSLSLCPSGTAWTFSDWMLPPSSADCKFSDGRRLLLCVFPALPLAQNRSCCRPLLYAFLLPPDQSLYACGCRRGACHHFPASASSGNVSALLR